MIKDRAVAEKISEIMLEISGLLDESVAFVEENCNEDELQDYAKVIGEIMGIIGIDVLNKIYRPFPEIKPEAYYLPLKNP